MNALLKGLAAGAILSAALYVPLARADGLPIYRLDPARMDEVFGPAHDGAYIPIAGLIYIRAGSRLEAEVDAILARIHSLTSEQARVELAQLMEISR